MMIPSPPKGFPRSREEGSALVVSVLILMVLTVLATAGFWLSHVEMTSGQAYAQSVRALYLADAGMARFFAGAGSTGPDSLVYEYYADPCADTVEYPTAADRTDCRADGEDEAEYLLTEFDSEGGGSSSFSYTNAEVVVSSRPIMTDGSYTTYEVSAQASIQDARNPDLVTTRQVNTYARVSTPFSAQAMFGATGGIEFDYRKDAHYHFESTSQAGEVGSCGADGSMPIVQTPSGTWDLESDKWGDCPYTDACGYDWHESGMGVDSTSTSGSEILDDWGINWTDLMDDSYYAGLPNVVEFTSSNDFEAYFDPSKEADFLAMDDWPISRVTGDPELYINTDIKGFGLLIIDGPFEITGGSTVIEWTGLIIVGDHLEFLARSHFHLKGGIIVGAGCTDAQRAAGDCEAYIVNDHTEILYRPCEIAQASRAFAKMTRIDDLFREASPGG